MALRLWAMPARSSDPIPGSPSARPARHRMCRRRPPCVRPSPRPDQTGHAVCSPRRPPCSRCPPGGRCPWPARRLRIRTPRRRPESKDRRRRSQPVTPQPQAAARQCPYLGGSSSNRRPRWLTCQGFAPSKAHPRSCAATEPTVASRLAISTKIEKKPSRQDSVDFSYPPEVEQFRKELRAWLAANLTDEVMAAGRRRGRDPDTFETTRARAPVPLNVIGMNNIAPAIMQYGTDSVKREFLPRMVRADDIWCQGMSEPEAGSDLASLRTRAVLDGDEYVVNGQKVWTSLGHRADWCQLYVRTDPDAPKHKGISCLIVQMSLPGIEVRSLVTLNGAADFAEVFFNDVRVPADALLGPLNSGWQVATTTLSHERAGAARLYAQLEVQLQDLVADLADAEVLEDGATLHRLGDLAVRIKYLEVLCQRSISATLHGSDALGSASLAKSVW